MARARNRGLTEREAQARGKWYFSRSVGQLERFERVESCSAESLVIRCQDCGHEHERPAQCSFKLLCLVCRGARARELRGRFTRARAIVVQEATQRGLLMRNHRGRAWGERFLTLTLPHHADDTIARRIHRLVRAWTRFNRLFHDWQKDHGLRSVHWLRVFEWTPGADRLGHPHLHVWVFSPYIPVELVREWWRRALHDGVTGLEHGSAVVDIRTIRGLDGGAQELVKYLTKDIDENGVSIPPSDYAQVYQALDGLRTVQASRGFMALAARGPRACEKCGSSLPRAVTRKNDSNHAEGE